MAMIQIAIGTQANQYVGQKVLEYSIRKHTRAELDLRFETQTQRRIGGTRFGFVRFTVPALFGYRGRAIYMDADQLVFGDVQELVDQLDDDHAIGIVRDLEGTFAGEPVEPRNETSVMVLDCEKLKSWDPETILAAVVPNDAPAAAGQIHYKDFMRLAWVDPSLIQEIDPRWNHYNLVRDDTRLVHFSHVREQPWKSPRHPYRDLWESWLAEAIERRALRRRDVLRAVARLHIHPYFLRYALG
jgi:lipopolysaccharide biosynthesis glycosyltransferase